MEPGRSGSRYGLHQVGCLDSREGLEVNAQIWTRCKLDWVNLDPNAAAFEKSPTP